MMMVETRKATGQTTSTNRMAKMNMEATPEGFSRRKQKGTSILATIALKSCQVVAHLGLPHLIQRVPFTLIFQKQLC
tara:strand:- start:104 stop:334 length:231 start_codon:yes stop_codon:yes gene_type:complete